MTRGTLAVFFRRELYERVRRDVPFEQKACDALDIGRQSLGVESGLLTRIDRETGHWEVVASTESRDSGLAPGTERRLESTYCRRVVEEDATVAIADATTNGWTDDLTFGAHGAHCYLGSPVFFDGETYGTICFVDDDPRATQFDTDEKLLSEFVARLLERELEREHYLSELDRQATLVSVLNRVLRHNLRNELSVVHGYTQLLVEKVDDEGHGEVALRHIERLLELAEKARELDRIQNAGSERTPTDVVTLLESVTETANHAYPDATLTVEYEERLTVPVLPSLERALEELVENAAKHGGAEPTVTIFVVPVPNAVEIRIRDDGPGLPEHEITAIEMGGESQLTHGSGLGLWLANWIVMAHDGDVEVNSTEKGTTVTVRIPRKPQMDGRRA